LTLNNLNDQKARAKRTQNRGGKEKMSIKTQKIKKNNYIRII